MVVKYVKALKLFLTSDCVFLLDHSLQIKLRIRLKLYFYFILFFSARLAITLKSVTEKLGTEK